MPGITLQQAQANLDALLGAAAAFDGVQEVTVSGRRIVFTSLKDLNDAVVFWDSQVKAKSAQTFRLTKTWVIGW
jgi:hypothetical protein